MEVALEMNIWERTPAFLQMCTMKKGKWVAPTATLGMIYTASPPNVLNATKDQKTQPSSQPTTVMEVFRRLPVRAATRMSPPVKMTSYSIRCTVGICHARSATRLPIITVMVAM